MLFTFSEIAPDIRTVSMPEPPFIESVRERPLAKSLDAV